MKLLTNVYQGITFLLPNVTLLSFISPTRFFCSYDYRIFKRHKNLRKDFPSVQLRIKKIKFVKNIVVLLLFVILPATAFSQISDFKKIEKFGLTWIQKEQAISPGQKVLLPSGSFISKVKTGEASIEKVGQLTQVRSKDKPFVFVWCSLVEEESEVEILFEKSISKDNSQLLSSRSDLLKEY